MRSAQVWWLGILVWTGSAVAGAESPPLTVPIEFGEDRAPVEVEVTLEAASGPHGEGWLARVDLVPLLVEGRSILRGQLPRDPCAKRGGDNWVAYLETFDARVERDRLRLRMAFDVEWWACLELGRSDLRRRLSRAQVEVELALGIELADEGLRLWAEPPRVRADGDLARAARLWFAARGEDWGDRLEEAVKRWNEQLPVFATPALGPFAGRLSGARFVDAGRPALVLETQLEWRPPRWWPKTFGGR